MSNDTQVKKSKFAELDKRDEAALQSEALARRSLNALAVTSSIVNALVQYPGPNGDHASMVDAAKSMLSQADEMASRLMTRLDLDSVPWARYRLMRMTTEAVSGRWMSSARSQDRPSADISGFLPIWREMAKHNLPTFHFEDPSDDSRVMMQISLLDAMQPVIQEITAFDLFHDHAKAAMHARNQIVKIANEVAADLMPPNASNRAQSLLLQALLRHAGSVYASNWRKCAQDVVDFLSPMSVRHQEEEVAKYPGGWPLESVDAGFRNTFEKLADMVFYLAKPSSLEAESTQKQSDESKVNPVENRFNPSVFSAANLDVPEEVPTWQDAGPSMPDDDEFKSTAYTVEPMHFDQSVEEDRSSDARVYQ